MLPYAVQPYMTVDLTLKHLLYVGGMWSCLAQDARHCGFGVQLETGTPWIPRLSGSHTLPGDVNCTLLAFE